MNKIKSVIFSTAFAFSALAAIPGAASAASAGLTVSPGSGTHYTGSSFAVSIVESSDTPVNGVEADINYDTSLLQLLGKSCGSSFEITAPSSGANLTCATVTPKTGGNVVGTLSFKALATGSASISIASSSQVTASDGQGSNVWDGSAAGGSYSIVTPAPVAATATTPPPAAPVAKAAPKRHSEQLTYTTRPATNKGISAWIYAPVAAVVALTGLAYIFRKDAAAWTKTAGNQIRKVSLVKGLF